MRSLAVHNALSALSPDACMASNSVLFQQWAAAPQTVRVFMQLIMCQSAPAGCLVWVTNSPRGPGGGGTGGRGVWDGRGSCAQLKCLAGSLCSLGFIEPFVQLATYCVVQYSCDSSANLKWSAPQCAMQLAMCTQLQAAMCNAACTYLSQCVHYRLHTTALMSCDVMRRLPYGQAFLSNLWP